MFVRLLSEGAITIRFFNPLPVQYILENCAKNGIFLHYNNKKVRLCKKKKVKFKRNNYCNVMFSQIRKINGFKSYFTELYYVFVKFYQHLSELT